MFHLKHRMRNALRLARGEPMVTFGEFDTASLTKMLAKPDPVILEIGCNDGGHTRKFLELFPNARIYAFEPDPRAIRHYRENVQDPRATLFEVAISDVDGTAEFHVSSGFPTSDWQEGRPGGWDASGSIRAPKEHLKMHPWCTFDDNIQVITKRLDTWRGEAGIEAIDFIWADVQGAEENLILGAREALDRTHYFYTEYNDAELYEGQLPLRGILDLLPNFRILKLFANDVLLENRHW